MENCSDRGMVCAVVTHGPIETRYRRTGFGPPVVVLGLDVADDDDRMRVLLAPLAARCRVIVPEHASITALVGRPGADGMPFSAWFHGFLEGLGIEGARVVAGTGLDTALTQFVAAHPGDVDRLLIVGASANASAVAPPLAPADPPVWRASAQVGWNEMLRFITAEPPGAQSLAAR
jgi:hypothetical protein